MTTRQTAVLFAVCFGVGPVQLRFGLWAGEHVAGRGDDLGVAALGR